jgi:hypothetical protein
VRQNEAAGLHCHCHWTVCYLHRCWGRSRLREQLPQCIRNGPDLVACGPQMSFADTEIRGVRTSFRCGAFASAPSHVHGTARSVRTIQVMNQNTSSPVQMVGDKLESCREPGLKVAAAVLGIHNRQVQKSLRLAPDLIPVDDVARKGLPCGACRGLCTCVCCGRTGACTLNSADPLFNIQNYVCSLKPSWRALS